MSRWLTIGSVWCVMAATALWAPDAACAAVLYRCDFESDPPEASGAWRTGAGGGGAPAPVVRIAQRAGSGPAQKRCLTVAGRSLWITAQTTFAAPLEIERPGCVAFDTRAVGRAWQTGVSVLIDGRWRALRRLARTVGGCTAHREWRREVWILDGLFGAGRTATIGGLRFAQRQEGPVVASGEPMPSGLPAQEMHLDSIAVLTGPDVRSACERSGGQRSYDGAQAFRFDVPDAGGLAVWHMPSLAKVFRRQPPPARTGRRVRLALARGEAESFQIVLRSDRPRDGLALAVAPLRSADGHEIAADAWSWHPVCYAPVDMRYFHIPVPRQWWPEPLSWNRTVTLEPGRTQPLWVTLRVPRTASAGAYRTTLALQAHGRTLLSVDAEVVVWPFALPRRPAFRTNQQLWLKSVYALDPRPRDAVLCELLETLARNRQFDANLFLRLEPELRARAVGQWGQNAVKLPFCGGHLHGPKRYGTTLAGQDILTPGYAKAFENLLESKLGALRRDGLASDAFLYLWDEPGGQDKEREMIAWLAKLARAAAPELRTLMAGPYDKRLRSAVDIFLHDYTHPDTVAEALADGVEFWWWGNSAFYVDLPAVDQRMRYGFESVQKGLTGAYSWGIATWPTKRADDGRSAADRAWLDTDRWNRNSIVLYPGARPESTSPRVLSSISLELNRDGIEDYDYVALLRQATHDPAKAAEARRLLERCKGLHRSPNGLREDFSIVEALTSLRRDVAALLSR